MSASYVVHRDADKFAVVVPKSTNIKTGPMDQLHILPNVNPIKALKEGKDRSVCADCPLSSKANGGNGSCYVVVVQGPNATWKASNTKPVVKCQSKRPIRLGAYGDPALLPMKLVRRTVRDRRWTGYTHQWHKRHTNWSKYLMASIDPIMAERQGMSVLELKALAQSKGYRTFRVLSEGGSVDSDEILCPNYTRGTQCIDCGLCNGSKENDTRKNIAIPAHGSGKNLLQIEG